MSSMVFEFFFDNLSKFMKISSYISRRNDSFLCDNNKKQREQCSSLLYIKQNAMKL